MQPGGHSQQPRYPPVTTASINKIIKTPWTAIFSFCGRQTPLISRQRRYLRARMITYVYVRSHSAREDALLPRNYRRLAPTKTSVTRHHSRSPEVSFHSANFTAAALSSCSNDHVRLCTLTFCARRCLAAAKLSTPGAHKNFGNFSPSHHQSSSPRTRGSYESDVMLKDSRLHRSDVSGGPTYRNDGIWSRSGAGRNPATTPLSIRFPPTPVRCVGMTVEGGNDG